MSALDDISVAGVSVWLDDLDRHRIESGGLARLVAQDCVVGVTTNPSIFEKALTTGVPEYAHQVATLRGTDVDQAIRELTVRDVQAACDILAAIHRDSGGVDGRVSLEVDPRLAHDTTGTARQAVQLWQEVDRANLMVKIPATDAGLPAITEALAQGVSVNVTLIFSVPRYRQVAEAWLAGLEQASANGHDLATIESVASFFVSRVDTVVDPQLDRIGTDRAVALRGCAAIANARLAWATYQDILGSPRWQALTRLGAHPQRPLWASTGVKDPTYDDTRYVVELVAPGCVNTMPESTLRAVADHGICRGDTVSGTREQAEQTWRDLADVGIDSDEVFATLEREGVEKFIAAWEALRTSLRAVLA